VYIGGDYAEGFYILRDRFGFSKRFTKTLCVRQVVMDVAFAISII